MSNELRIEGLSKTYPNGVRALRDVTLTIPTGMFGLLGPNGAGKSTLMRTIATLQEADSGSIPLGDLDVLRDKDAVRRILGYLPQEFGVYPRISAEAMLDHFAVLKGITKSRERKEVVAALLRRTPPPTSANPAIRTSAPTPAACASASASRRHSSAIRN